MTRLLTPKVDLKGWTLTDHPAVVEEHSVLSGSLRNDEQADEEVISTLWEDFEEVCEFRALLVIAGDATNFKRLLRRGSRRQNRQRQLAQDASHAFEESEARGQTHFRDCQRRNVESHFR